MFILNEPKIDNRSIPIDRKYLLLLFLASIPAGVFKSSNLQRGLFIITKEIPEICIEPYFFESGSYGPRSETIFKDVEVLENLSLVRSFPNLQTMASRQGLEFASEMTGISEYHSNYITKVANWIIDKTFIDLICIFRKYYPNTILE